MIPLRSLQKSVSVRRIAAVIAVSLVALIGRSSAQSVFQSLTFSLLERYLELLRVQAAIPGMSALILATADRLGARFRPRGDRPGDRRGAVYPLIRSAASPRRSVRRCC